MDKESQYLLFALSSPMGVNEDCLPSHSSPKIFRDKRFDLESRRGVLKIVMSCFRPFPA
ncbi:hypothetical protein KCP71_24075 [Salmonella enterica subsp. enterica]|nr:hypothetical protein KCP71_24075 [Salmonella enterica subsp. enterica]